jgi:hypothetical protein
MKWKQKDNENEMNANTLSYFADTDIYRCKDGKEN